MNPVPVSHDEELLGLAQRVLEREGFSALRATFEDVPCLVAENAWFILGVVTAVHAHDLVEANASVGLALASEVGSADVRDKSWDVCLVLLTSDHLAWDQRTSLEAISYDTHYLRRVVRTDVAASPDAVRRALQGFLPLPHLNGAEVVADPLDLLVDDLPSHGVDRAEAERVVTAFRASGEVPDD